MPDDYKKYLYGSPKGEVNTITKTLQLNGAGATTGNLFLVSGAVKVTRLWGIVTVNTDNTSCTGVSFQAYDGTNTVQLTKNDGVLTSMVVGAIMMKAAAAATTAVIVNADQVNLEETLTDVHSQFMLVPKLSTASYIRIAYTGATGFDVTMKFYCDWIPLEDSAELTAV